MNAPDHMPPHVKRQTVRQLIETIQGFCNESMLPLNDIVGALEGCKFALLRDAFESESEDK